MMLNILSMFATTLTLAFSGGTAGGSTADVADLVGTYQDPTGGLQTITVSLMSDGAATDSLSRSGSYDMSVNAAGDPVMTLTLDRDVHVMQVGGAGCWEEAQPPVNPGLQQLAICIQSNAHRLVEYDMQTCGDPDDFPIVDAIAPLPAENGHWYAGRLTTNYPNGYWINDFSYYLFTDLGGTTCAALDHKVQLFLGPANGLPGANPVVLYEETISAASLSAGWDEVIVDLPQPILLPAGQSAFISVEMPHTGSQMLCVADCTNSPSPDLSFWSNATAPAYPWADVEPWGFGDMMVYADGIANQ